MTCLWHFIKFWDQGGRRHNKNKGRREGKHSTYSGLGYSQTIPAEQQNLSLGGRKMTLNNKL